MVSITISGASVARFTTTRVSLRMSARAQGCHGAAPAGGGVQGCQCSPGPRTRSARTRPLPEDHTQSVDSLVKFAEALASELKEFDSSARRDVYRSFDLQARIRIDADGIKNWPGYDRILSTYRPGSPCWIPNGFSTRRKTVARTRCSPGLDRRDWRQRWCDHGRRGPCGLAGACTPWPRRRLAWRSRALGREPQ